MHHLLDAWRAGERADERPYGGGPGMVLRIEPLARTLDAIVAEAPADERRRIVLTSASGPLFRHADAAAWAGLDRLVLICGHYEGVDERLGALYPIEESLPRRVRDDRRRDRGNGVSGRDRSLGPRRHRSRFRRRRIVGGRRARTTLPIRVRRRSAGSTCRPVLLSGDHAKIAEWRRSESRRRAIARRADKPPSRAEGP